MIQQHSPEWEIEKRNCKNCDQVFIKSKFHKNHSFCSNKCYMIHYAKKERFCTLCSTNIIRPKRHLFCSDKCMIRSKSKKMMEKHRDKIRERKKKYNLINSERLKEQRRIYYLDNREKILLRVRKNFLKRNGERLLKNKLIREEKKKILPQRRREYEKQYYTGFRKLLKNISRDLNSCIKKDRKTSKYLEIFGYNRDQLKNHLQKHFTKEMTWENYGKVWHLDHKIPKIWFDVRKNNIDVDIEQLKKCWGLENLQPLLAADNLRKGARYAG